MFIFSYDGKADYESYYLLQKANIRNSPRVRSAVLIRRVLLIAAAVLVMRSVLNLLAARQAGANSDLTGLFGILFGLIMFVTAIVYAIWFLPLSARRAARTANRNSGGPGELRFEAESIRSWNEKSDSTIPYSTVRSVYRSGDHFFLFISENQAIIADLARLTEGDAAKFESFLRGKTEKEIQTL